MQPSDALRMKLKPTAMAIAAAFPNDWYAHTPDFRSCRPWLPMRALVARQTRAEMIKEGIYFGASGLGLSHN